MKTIVYYDKNCKKTTISMTNTQRRMLSFLAGKKGFARDCDYLYSILENLERKEGSVSSAVRDYMFIDLKKTLEK